MGKFWVANTIFNYSRNFCNKFLGNIGKQISGINGASILKENNVSIKLAGKVVDLTPSLALKITKFIIKKAIQKGIGY